MFIIGIDYHPSFQQIAFVNQETGECDEQRRRVAQVPHFGTWVLGLGFSASSFLLPPTDR